METQRTHELRDQAKQWRATAERISDADPKAAEALNDLASRLDRQLFMLEHPRMHVGAAPMPSSRTVAS
jgi:CHAD domain-containing protein